MAVAGLHKDAARAVFGTPKPIANMTASMVIAKEKRLTFDRDIPMLLELSESDFYRIVI
jgi:hypothetical protein